MCAISGIIGKDWNQDQLNRMVKIQHHRGPDDQGIFISENKQVGLGHNRLMESFTIIKNYIHA